MILFNSLRYRRHTIGILSLDPHRFWMWELRSCYDRKEGERQRTKIMEDSGGVGDFSKGTLYLKDRRGMEWQWDGNPFTNPTGQITKNTYSFSSFFPSHLFPLLSSHIIPSFFSLSFFRLPFILFITLFVDLLKISTRKILKFLSVPLGPSYHFFRSILFISFVLILVILFSLVALIGL